MYVFGAGRGGIGGDGGEWMRWWVWDLPCGNKGSVGCGCVCVWVAVV